MGEVEPDPVGGVCPTVNGGSSGVVTTMDTTKVSQSTFEKNARGDKWDFEEDMALMSAWCVARELQSRGKTQMKLSLWAQIKKLYDETHAQSSKKIGPRNKAQMKGRWKRLNESAIKWIDANRKAYRQKTSDMSSKDIENEAHKIYAASGKTYNDIIVFNEVMSKHPKWELRYDRNTTPSCRKCEVCNDESGGSTKRTMTNKKGEYYLVYNPETPNNGGSTIYHAYKKKEKCKVSHSSSFHDEYLLELHAMRITRDNEVEVMRKTLELEQRKEERKDKKEERKSKKAYHMHLNTLLAKKYLSPEDEDMKRHLWAMLYGK